MKKPETDCIAQGIECGQPEMQVACQNVLPGNAYLWSGPNNFASTEAEPIITDEGTYCVTVTSAFGCNATGCLDAVLDTVIPQSTITPPDPELCQDSFFITATSIPPNSFQQEWTTNGGFIAYTSGNFIWAGGEGEYCVIHTNLANNCADTACTDVVIWGDPPIADAGPSHILSCVPTDSVQLGSPNTSTGPQFTYEWTCFGCPSGNPAPIPNPWVSDVGDYELKVTDTTTGCVAYSTTTVEDDIYFDFSYDAAVCLGDSATIFAVVSSSNPPYNIYIGENGDTLFKFLNFPQTSVLTIPITEPTVFEIWATDAMGCDTPTVYTMPITFDSTEIDFTVETDGCKPVTVTASYSSNLPKPQRLDELEHRRYRVKHHSDFHRLVHRHLRQPQLWACGFGICGGRL